MSDTPIENEQPSGESPDETPETYEESPQPQEGGEIPAPPDPQPPPAPRPYYTYPDPQYRRPPPAEPGGNWGCWLVGLATGFIVTGLVVAGLLLPPVDLLDRLFGKDYAVLSPQANAAPTDGLILSVSPDDPGSDFGVALDQVTAADFLANDSGAGDWIPAANAAIPRYLTLLGHVYTIDTTGVAPNQVMFTIDLPAEAPNPDIVEMYAWNEGDSAWRFVPSRPIADETGKQMRFARIDYVPDHIALFAASPADPVVLTLLETGQTVSPQVAGVVTIVSPTGMRPSLPTTPQRTLVGNPSAGFDLNAGYRVMPVIRNYSDPRATDVDTVVAIVGNRELRAEHIRQLTAFTSAGQYDGIFLDYRDLPAEQRPLFTAFVEELSASLHTYNLRLGVVVPQATITDNNTWETGAYNWRALGETVDYLQINLTLKPTAFADDELVETVTRWAVSEVSRYKLLAGLSALSVREVSGSYTTIGYPEALAQLGNVRLTAGNDTLNPGEVVAPGSVIVVDLDGPDALPGVDTTIRTPFINYLAEDGTAAATMWLTTGEALNYRLQRLAPFGLGGIAFPDLLAAGVVNNLFDVLLNYRIQLATTLPPTELALQWRIESAEERIAEFTTGFNEEIVVTIDAPEGNYAVNVDVVGGNISSARSGAPVAVFAPTITPTPLPTNTPLPTPTPTASPLPIIATMVTLTSDTAGGTAPTTVPLNPIFPPGGSIAVGNFEYGGHVHNANSPGTIGAMKQAGMTWLKVQIVWSVSGIDRGEIGNTIGLAHNNGFKVLLSIVGIPSELAASGGTYIRQFAGFLGDVADLGPDAIEVWNEPNIDREWPTGQIGGGNYTAMLGEAYRTIKSRNPNVIVISAAPSPTGAEAAYPGQVVNDDNFLRQMVNAGALQYMDCVGMHYNEGIVPPRNTSGDPRDNYYTRYLPTMLDMYWNITSGQRPICITELGYLSPQGYGGLSEYWAWASNVTIEQQAAWLADAAAYSSQTGRVRLLIVWNVDFTHYDANDPMAGYAMIRANGDCPACRALAGAR